MNSADVPDVRDTSEAPDAAVGWLPPLTPTLDSIYLSPRNAQAFLRLVERSSNVQRRFQFFVWMESDVQVLLPHALAICGAYSRQRKQLQFDVFNSIALPSPLLDALGAPGSPLMTLAGQWWVQGQCRARSAPLAGEGSPWRDLDVAGQLALAGLHSACVHGVSRPERPHEIETLFLFADVAAQPAAAHMQALELVLPHLHATFLHTQSVEREFGAPAPLALPPPQPRPTAPVTARELQILHWVREGKSNQEIGDQLGIRVPTVKNHIQKVLRKLGASNRAHAVTLAVRLRALPGAPDGEDPGRDGTT